MILTYFMKVIDSNADHLSVFELNLIVSTVIVWANITNAPKDYVACQLYISIIVVDPDLI